LENHHIQKVKQKFPGMRSLGIYLHGQRCEISIERGLIGIVFSDVD
jgi:hypothetical protein